MPPSRALPKGTRFVVPTTGHKKYVAHVPINGVVRRVPFGDNRYEHYRDSVPTALGGGKWSHRDHLDPRRRRNYRSRHGASTNAQGEPYVSQPYSAAWFSYHFLW